MLNPLKLAQQMRDMQKKMKQVQSDLQKQQITVSNNTVQITMTGEQKVVDVQLNPDVVGIPNRETLEKVLQDTINEAIEKVQKLSVEKMKDVTGGMNIPGLPGM